MHGFDAKIVLQIINEFLISKDKPVAHFRRRQPNILLMQVTDLFKALRCVQFEDTNDSSLCSVFQKFAYDKMEWPKHYTSEKVLVLVTYTELMKNRKHGREMSSQLKPLR